MDVRITTRNANVGDSFLRQAGERVQKLERYEPRLQSVTILVAEDRGRISVEARAEVPGVPTVVASATGDSERGALDGALQKLRRRLRRGRSRRVDHQAPPAGAASQD
jgi:ribosomal subunit interface protein